MTTEHDAPIIKPRIYTVSLTDLPDEILLRIIHLTGSPGTQVGSAYILGAVSNRLRRLLKTQFLTSITKLSHDWISPLSLSDASAARASLTSMFASTPAVKELTLNGCSPTLLTKTCLTALARTARTSLRTVNLAYCRVTDDVVRPLLCCPRLRTLVLQRCEGLTGCLFGDGSFEAPLEHLDLSWVHTLTSHGLSCVAKVATLKSLVLKGCESLNSKSVQPFIESQIRFSLTSLCVAYCPLREASLFDLLQNTPNLKKLSLTEHSWTNWITGDFPDYSIDQLRTTYPNLEIVFVA